MDKPLAHLLGRLSFRRTPIEEEQLMKEVLRDCKIERKKLRRDLAQGKDHYKNAIKEKGINIFEKQGIRVSELLNGAIGMNLVEVHISDYGERKVLISREGRDFLTRIYTNDFSDEYLQFENEVNRKMKDAGELELRESQLASLFWYGWNVKDACAHYLEKDTFQKEMEAYHNYLLQMNGVGNIEGKYIFHFTPKLFLPIGFITDAKNVVLQIEGIETPSGMILKKPYPNKRYIVAGVKIGKEKTSAGFYPIIADKEDFPRKIDITLGWKIGEHIQITHELSINFEFNDYAGNFFSSEQRLSRGSTLDEFVLTTFVEEDFELWGDRNYSFHYNNPDEIVIKENVTLSHFPIKLHSAFYADDHFRMWREIYKEN
ncbi:hypothetical protein [Bacillus paralicheniformis]|uniref:hypothetical protein n=1 Tax=Bacillus paralicheniformis TaxID=1648923 RepID=UPI001FD68D69|nr:hypothetical protein [Bacillus paralicheniformis]MCJ8223670.1 hypothetical protein [Bacillus paralicheniformis]